MQTIKTITIERAKASDANAIYWLLEKSKLPIAGLAAHLGTTLVARESETVIGSVALEIYEDQALLRSVAVADEYRGQRLGKRLMQEVLSLARQERLNTLYLLTETAEKFFEEFGFQTISRADVVSRVKQSVEFTGACPASAIVMKLELF